MRSLLWLIIDTGWFLVTAAATVLAVVAMIATPIWLGMIHAELVALRADRAVCVCGCRDDDGPGPVLPRVLPRLRNLREEGGE